MDSTLLRRQCHPCASLSYVYTYQVIYIYVDMLRCGSLHINSAATVIICTVVVIIQKARRPGALRYALCCTSFACKRHSCFSVWWHHINHQQTNDTCWRGGNASSGTFRCLQSPQFMVDDFGKHSSAAGSVFYAVVSPQQHVLMIPRSGLGFEMDRSSPDPKHSPRCTLCALLCTC